MHRPDQKVVHVDAHRARTQFGFLRMWSIHPAQIRPIVDAMKPDFDEVQDAAEILCAAQDVTWGPIQYKGELHDRATYRYFWSVLVRARPPGWHCPTRRGCCSSPTAPERPTRRPGCILHAR